LLSTVKWQNQTEIIVSIPFSHGYYDLLFTEKIGVLFKHHNFCPNPESFAQRGSRMLLVWFAGEKSKSFIYAYRTIFLSLLIEETK
jgi:hypothetical protein